MKNSFIKILCLGYLTVLLFGCNSNEDELEALENQIALLATDLKGRITAIETKIGHLPTSSDVTRLESKIAELKTQVRVSEDGLKEGIEALEAEIVALEWVVNPPTANKVKDDETLKAFVLWSKFQFEAIQDIDEEAELRDRLMKEGDFKDGSTFLIIFLPTGEPLIHGNDRTAENKNLGNIEDEQGLKVVEKLLEIASEKNGGFVAYQDRGETKKAYSISYHSGVTGQRLILVGGYKQDVSHVSNFIPDFPPPSINASQVSDRETLITFVEEAVRIYTDAMANNIRSLAGIRNAFREEGSNWKSGSVYLWVVSDGGINIFHGSNASLEGQSANLDRTDINGVPFVEALIVGARREGQKFLEYYYDDPSIEGDEDTGSPKLGYAVSFNIPGNTSEQKVVMGSGIYLGQR
ncbi:MAG: cache domain-containing protein [Flavobacteriaceae bacterium]|nr:cache domain-containing protein [Flavobacteriaceae bacterium]MCY4267777.1 cache domain-containing protein [Flavobacteriaceae bacterium]